MKRNSVQRLVAMTCTLLLILSGIHPVSAQAKAKTTLPKLEAPAASLATGTYDGPQTIRLSGPAGATIRYTVNGRTPTASSTKYSKPITVTKKTTVKAIAIRKGYTNSAVFTATLNVRPIALAAPVASLASGTYTGTQTVRLSGPAGATIRYTVNGKTPTASSTKYSKPIKVDKGMTIKAIAIKTGCKNSPVMAVSYSFKVPDPGAAYIPANKTLPLGGGSIIIKAPKDTTLYVKLNSASQNSELNYDVSDVSTTNYDCKLLSGRKATLNVTRDAQVQVLLVRKGYANNIIIRYYLPRANAVVDLGDQFKQQVLDGINWSRENCGVQVADGSIIKPVAPAVMDARLCAIAQAHAMKLASENQLYHTGYDIDESVCADQMDDAIGIGVQSSVHNGNLNLPQTTLIGIGAARALDGTKYVVVQGGSEEKVAALAQALGIK